MNDNWYIAGDMEVDTDEAFNRVLESIDDDLYTVKHRIAEVAVKTKSKKLLAMTKETIDSLEKAYDTLLDLVYDEKFKNADWSRQ